MDEYWDWLPAFRWGEEAQEVWTPPSDLFSADVIVSGMSSVIVWLSSFLWSLMLWAVRAGLSADLTDSAGWRIDRAAALSSSVYLSAGLGVAVVGGAVYLLIRLARKGDRTEIMKRAAVSVVCLSALVVFLQASGESDRKREQWDRAVEDRERYEAWAADPDRTGFLAEPEVPGSRPESEPLSGGWWLSTGVNLVTSIGSAVGESLRFANEDVALEPLTGGTAEKSPFDCAYYIAELNRRSEAVSNADNSDSFGSRFIARAMSDLWVNVTYNTSSAAQWGESPLGPSAHCRLLESRSRQSPPQQLDATVDAAAGPGCDMEYQQNSSGEWEWEWAENSDGTVDCSQPDGFWLGDQAVRILLGDPQLEAADFDLAGRRFITGLEYLASDVRTCEQAGLDTAWAAAVGAQLAACSRLAHFLDTFTLEAYSSDWPADGREGRGNADKEYGWLSMVFFACGASEQAIADAVGPAGGGDAFPSWLELDGRGRGTAATRAFRPVLAGCLEAMSAALGTAGEGCSPAVDCLPDGAQSIEPLDNVLRNEDWIENTFGTGAPGRVVRGTAPQVYDIPSRLTSPHTSGEDDTPPTVRDLLSSVRWAAESFNADDNDYLEIGRLFISLVLAGVAPSPEGLLARAEYAYPEGALTESFRTHMSSSLHTRITAVVEGSREVYLPTIDTQARSERIRFKGDDSDDFRLSELLDYSYTPSSPNAPEPRFAPAAHSQLFRPPVNYYHAVRIANFWVMCVPNPAADGSEPTEGEYQRWRENMDLTGLWWHVRDGFAEIAPLGVSQAENRGDFSDFSSGATLDDLFDQEWGHVCAAVWSGAAAEAGARTYTASCGGGGFFSPVTGFVCTTKEKALNLVGRGHREFVANDITDVRPVGAGAFELRRDQIAFTQPTNAGDGSSAAALGVSDDALRWLDEANGRDGPGRFSRLSAASVSLLVTISMFALMGVIVLMVLGAQIALLVGFTVLPLVLFVGVIPSEKTQKVLGNTLALLGFSLVAKSLAVLALSVIVLSVWVLTVMSFSVFGGVGFRWAYLLATAVACVVMLVFAKKLWRGVQQVVDRSGVSAAAGRVAGPLAGKARDVKSRIVRRVGVGRRRVSASIRGHSRRAVGSSPRGGAEQTGGRRRLPGGKGRRQLPQAGSGSGQGTSSPARHLRSGRSDSNSPPQSRPGGRPDTRESGWRDTARNEQSGEHGAAQKNRPGRSAISEDDWRDITWRSKTGNHGQDR